MKIIDPFDSLVFAMASSPGGYAMLLGSGVSRSAGVPTGWEIVCDLIRRVATSRGDDCGEDPVAWYRERSGEDPDYSGLIGQLAPKPLERQQLLSAYFEAPPSPGEVDRRKPTPAHRAIARLSSLGLVKIIVTTNFDRLMEAALEAEGVAPVVVSTDAQVEGVPPLRTIQCLVLKINGDYKNASIRNTADELAQYSPPLEALLDRILEEYGVVVCGWSADWDTALRQRLEARLRGRFSLFWAHRGDQPEGAALGLVRSKNAECVQVADADEFFSRLATRLEALSSANDGRSLSTAAAVAELKHLILLPERRIAASDLLEREVERVLEVVRGNSTSQTRVVTRDPVTHLEALNSGARVSATLEALLSTGARWNREANAVMSGASELLIGSALALLPPSNEATRGGAEGGNLVLALRAAYAIGIGGVLRRDYRLIGQLFHQAIWSPRRNRRIALVELLNPIDILDHDLLRAAYKPDPQRRYRFPHSEYLRATLRPSCSEICRDDARFARAFDTFEFLLGFSTYVLSGDRFWGPCGSWAIRAEYQDSVVAELSEEFRRDGVRWGPISEGLIPASEFESAWAQMESYVRFARNWAEKAAWG